MKQVIALIAGGVALLQTAAFSQSGRTTSFGGAQLKGDPSSWVRDSDYPKEARKEHRSGLTKFSFDIDETGRLVNCSVTQSSGSPDLDAKTCEVMTKRVRCRPLMVDGKPQVAHGFSQLQWMLP